MDWTTLAVAVAANAVAIVAIYFAYKQHRASLDQQRRLTDLASVRDLIDETATHLHVVATELDQIRLRLTTRGQGFFESKEGTEHAEGSERLRELSRVGDELDVLRERLAVRLGEQHPAVVKITDVDEAVLAIWRALDGIRFNVDRDADPGHGQAWVRNYFDEQHVKITQQREVFDAARKAFVTAAHSAAGAELPPTTTRPRRVTLVRARPAPAQQSSPQDESPAEREGPGGTT